MPTTPHIEKHFAATETVRDIVIGMADGLTVPFALAAGLSGAALGTGIVVTAGLAEIAAGSIAMGLGGYLAAKTDQEHYASERERELREVREQRLRILDRRERVLVGLRTVAGVGGLPAQECQGGEPEPCCASHASLRRWRRFQRGPSPWR